MKGVDTAWATSQVYRDIIKVGAHGKIMLKVDQENALVDLVISVAYARVAERQSSRRCQGVIRVGMVLLKGPFKQLRGTYKGLRVFP